MKFIDEVQVSLISGDGGDGCSSFRRENSFPKVGQVGDGGKGGDVILISDSNINTLSSFRYKKVLKAENGQNGQNKDKYGKSGVDLIIKVPIGTIVSSLETNQIIVDMDHDKKIRLDSRRFRRTLAISILNQAQIKHQPNLLEDLKEADRL